MEAELETTLRALLAKHKSALLEQGAQAALDDEQRQHERGDEFVIGGMAVFETRLEGYELTLQYDVENPKDIVLLSGKPFTMKAV